MEQFLLPTIKALGLLLTTVTLTASAKCNGTTCDPFKRCSEDELVRTPFRENATFHKIYKTWQEERFPKLSNIEAGEDKLWWHAPCGRMGGDLQPIVDGDIAPDMTMPWVVRIRAGSTIVLNCTGSLISDKWVATVAHCIPENKSEPVIVMLGRVADVKGINDDTFDEIIEAQLTIRHAEYKNFYRHDVGLIKLNRSVIFTDRIRPICLPQRYDFLFGGYRYKECYIAGYGWTTPTRTKQSLVFKLKYLQYTILEYDKCRLQWGWSYWCNHLCAAPTSKPGGTACYGDSGGPLMCVIPGVAPGKRFHLMGMVSYGTSKPCSSDKQANVFTRVTPYLDWLRTKVKSLDGSLPNYWTVHILERFYTSR